MTEIARTVTELRARVDGWRAKGEAIALVPTMGYLHEAHLQLIDAARARCPRVVVSVFVNPTQFGENEDFTRYPRDEAGDLAKLEMRAVDLAFAPSVEEMYPDGFATAVTVSRLTRHLCGTGRPGHFSGVATVCAKLFLQCRPDVALFGEKDYQQLQVIRRMVRDLGIAVEICALPTVREADGLAISSRNVYLNDDERARAGAINRILCETADRLARGGEVGEEMARGRAALDNAVRDQVEYLELCDAETLEPVTALERPARLLTAVRIGATRLIDNCPVIPAGRRD